MLQYDKQAFLFYAGLILQVRGETSLDVSKRDEGESCQKSSSSPPTWLENRQKEVSYKF